MPIQVGVVLLWPIVVGVVLKGTMDIVGPKSFLAPRGAGGDVSLSHSYPDFVAGSGIPQDFSY